MSCDVLQRNRVVLVEPEALEPRITRWVGLRETVVLSDGPWSASAGEEWARTSGPVAPLSVAPRWRRREGFPQGQSSLRDAVPASPA